MAIRLGQDGWVQWGQLARALEAVDSTDAALAALDTATARARQVGDSTSARGLQAARARLEE
jgi:hypothetical protein